MFLAGRVFGGGSGSGWRRGSGSGIRPVMEERDGEWTDDRCRKAALGRHEPTWQVPVSRGGVWGQQILGVSELYLLNHHEKS